MEFQWSYFKSWKMMLWECCTQYASKFGKLSSGHKTGKGQFSFQSQRRAMPKNAQTTTQLPSSHTLAKECSKFSSAFSKTSLNIRKFTVHVLLKPSLENFEHYFPSVWECCTQYASKFGKLSSGHRTGKGQFSFHFQRKEMPKNAQTTTQLHSSHTLVN